MSNCLYCKYPLSNNKAVSCKCTYCNTVWCANGNCAGSSGRPQRSRTTNSLCLTCQKVGGIMKI